MNGKMTNSVDFHIEALRCGDLFVDLVAHRASWKGQPVHLGPTQFAILQHLMTCPGKIFTREQLHEAVWGHRMNVERRTVDVHIRRIRKALDHAPGSGVVRTVRGVGYALEAASDTIQDEARDLT